MPVIENMKKKTVKGEKAKAELWQFLKHYSEHSLMGCSAVG
jgi:hypothetical protein